MRIEMRKKTTIKGEWARNGVLNLPQIVIILNPQTMCYNAMVWIQEMARKLEKALNYEYVS